MQNATEQLQELQSRKAELDTKLAETMSGLSKANSALEYQSMEAKKSKDMLEAKKEHIAQLQVQHREEELKLQTKFNEKMDEVQLELTESNKQKDSLNQTKESLEKQVQENAVETATLKGEMSRLEDKLYNSTRDYERSQQENTELNQKLTMKGNELIQTIESFNKSQRTSEERITTLNDEKMAQYEKLNGEKMELYDKINGLREEKVNTGVVVVIYFYFYFYFYFFFIIILGLSGQHVTIYTSHHLLVQTWRKPSQSQPWDGTCQWEAWKL